MQNLRLDDGALHTSFRETFLLFRERSQEILALLVRSWTSWVRAGIVRFVNLSMTTTLPQTFYDPVRWYENECWASLYNTVPFFHQKVPHAVSGSDAAIADRWLASVIRASASDEIAPTLEPTLWYILQDHRPSIVVQSDVLGSD
jgi:hypothetical protein